MNNDEKNENKAREESVDKKPRLSLQFSEPVRKILYRLNYFIFECSSYILTYSLYSKEKIYFKVATNNYFITEFPPHLFACVIGQFLYFYSEDALIDAKFIQKAKISKMNVKAICSYNKGYFMGGYNRTPLPGGKLIDKRTIYYLEDISVV